MLCKWFWGVQRFLMHFLAVLYLTTASSRSLLACCAQLVHTYCMNFPVRTLCSLKSHTNNHMLLLVLLSSCCLQTCSCSLANLPEVAGCEAKLRMDGDKPYVTDNHNFIVDLYFQVNIPARV